MLSELTTRVSQHNSPKLPKLPLRPLKLPRVVAAHEYRRSTMLMNAMTSRALYAQTIEGHTPALAEHAADSVLGSHFSDPITDPEVTPRRSLWSLFSSWILASVSAVQLFIQTALCSFTRSRRPQAPVPPTSKSDATISHRVKSLTTPDAGSILPKYHNDSEELAIWQSLEHEQPDPSKRPYYRVRLFEEAYPDMGGTDPNPIRRHTSLVELSPQSVVSATWTVAVRHAHTRKGPVSVDELQHPPDAHFYP